MKAIASKDFRRFTCGAHGCLEHVDVPFPEHEPVMHRATPRLPPTWGWFGVGDETAYMCPTHVERIVEIVSPSKPCGPAPTRGPYR